nr:methyltransferase domain-containing protein [uncultured Acidocella sp.]
MSLIALHFAKAAKRYDEIAQVQPRVAAALAARLGGAPRRILEIGCGTGGLSQHLARLFPQAELVLTDISAEMLEICEARLGGRGRFLRMDGQAPDAGLGRFELIVSSLAMQWFEDLPASLERLAAMLAPGGEMRFATLGAGTFAEWRAVLGDAGGLHAYPAASEFPWRAQIEAEIFVEHHASGRAFLRALKAIGAQTPRAGHRPVSASVMRRALARTANGFDVRYEVLFGSYVKP